MKNKNKIVWISSYPKSGNTWIRVALNLALTGHLNLNKIQINSFSGLMLYHVKDLKKLVMPGDVRHFWEKAQNSIVSKLDENALICLKTHNVSGDIGGVKFPSTRFTAGFIYIVRDPRDVAVSYSNHFNISIDDAIKVIMKEDNFIFKSSSLYRSEYISSWNNHVLSWSKSKFPRLILKYEDLLDDAYHCFEKLFKFCNITPKIDIDLIVKLSSFRNLVQLETKFGFKESNSYGTPFFNKGESKSWMNYPKNSFNKIEDLYGDLMSKFKYF